jgi:hypothetical protein
MKHITREELQELTAVSGFPCISIFMPTHKKGSDVVQDPIRYKNLIRQAEEKLTDQQCEEILKPAQELINDSLFWKERDNALAVFVSKGIFRYYRIPVECDESVHINDRFLLKPMLKLMSTDGRFYILSLSLGNIKFYECSPYDINEIRIENIPRNIDDVLRYYETDRSVDSHLGGLQHGGQAKRATQASGYKGSNSVYHGQQGSSEENLQPKYVEFFRQIDQGLHNILKDEKAPLIIASVEYLQPLYKEANTYHNLVKDGINGNPDLMTAEEIMDKALRIVQPILNNDVNDVKKKFGEFFGTGKATTDIDEVVPASFYGRIDKLLISAGQQKWGRFDEVTGKVDIHEEKNDGDIDLIDFAAVQTFLKDGKVFIVKPEEIPNRGYMAALMRY